MISAVSGLALLHNASNPKDLAVSYGSWSGIRTNHVVSSSGSFFDENRSSRGLSTIEDLELLLALRKHADLVIVDAETARNEKYGNLSSAHLAIVSASGNFKSIPAASSSTGVSLFSPVAPNVDSDCSLEHVEVHHKDPFDALQNWATQRKMNSLLLEAGPTLTRLCFATNSVTQSAITVTPKQAADHRGKTLNPFTDKGSLASLAESDSATFALWHY